jgi:hypothetical protein
LRRGCFDGQRRALSAKRASAPGVLAGFRATATVFVIDTSDRILLFALCCISSICRKRFPLKPHKHELLGVALELEVRTHPTLSTFFNLHAYGSRMMEKLGITRRTQPYHVCNQARHHASS